MLPRGDGQEAEHDRVQRSRDGNDHSADLVVPDEIFFREPTMNVPLSAAGERDREHDGDQEQEQRG